MQMALNNLARWISSWFVIDPRSLGAFRIALGLILAYDCVTRMQDFSVFYSSDGLIPPQPLPFGRWSLHLVSDHPFYQYTLFSIALIASLCFIFGWKSRISAIVCWILLISLHSRAPLVLHGGDALLRVLLMWGLFLPLNCRYSVDSWRKPELRLTAPIGGVPAACILLQVIILYLFSSIFKMGDAWQGEGNALHDAFELDAYGTELAQFMLGYPSLLKVVTHLTVWFEEFGPLIALCPAFHWGGRVFIVILFIVFHLFGIGAILRIGIFPFVCAAAWLLFLPTGFWNWALFRGSASEIAQPQPESYSSWSARLILGFIPLILLMVIVIGNLFTIQPNLPKPRALKVLEYAIRIDQRWALFAPSVRRVEYWYSVVGVSADKNRHVLFGIDPSEASPDKLWDYSQTCSHRLRKYLNSVSKNKNKHLLEALGRYALARSADNGAFDEVSVYAIIRKHHTEPPFQIEIKQIATFKTESGNFPSSDSASPVVDEVEEMID